MASDATAARAHDTPRYQPREAWRHAWGLDLVRARDRALDRDVVLVRSRVPTRAVSQPELPEPWQQVALLGAWNDDSVAWSVEHDAGQRMVPEQLSRDVATAVVHAAAALLVELARQDVDCTPLGVESLRILAGGQFSIVPVGAGTSNTGLERAPLDGAAIALRRMLDQLEAAPGIDLDASALRSLAIGPDGCDRVREACARSLQATGMDPRILAARLDAAATSADDAARAPRVDTPESHVELPGRWDEEELAARTWRNGIGSRLLLVVPVALLVLVFGVAVVAADRRDARQASMTTTAEKMRTIATSTGDVQADVSEALEEWNGDAAGLARLRETGTELRQAARTAQDDAAKLQLTSVSEAQAHAALRGMLAGQEALGQSLQTMPADVDEIEATAFQDALLRARVVTGDFIGLGVALASLGQKAMDDAGYGGLAESAEHSLDVAIEEEAERFAGSQTDRQKRLQRRLQDRLLESMEQEQALAEERLQRAQAGAGAGLGDVQAEVIARMAEAFDVRLADMSKRATALEATAAALRPRATAGCVEAGEQLQANVLARQQLVLELNSTAAPTADGLERQVALVTRLGRGIRADQALLQRLSTERAAQTSAAGAAPEATALA